MWYKILNWNQKAIEKSKKGNGGSRIAQQNPTNLKLSSVDLAFYLAYNKGLNSVLSDA